METAKQKLLQILKKSGDDSEVDEAFYKVLRNTIRENEAKFEEHSRQQRLSSQEFLNRQYTI